jgi:DNA-binding PadR family transcriptional regulator
MSPPPLPLPSSGLKGFLKMYTLQSLSKEPHSGYELIAKIKEKTNGDWIPSKGAVYPILSSLEKEGLIRVKSIGPRSKRVYQATPTGRKLIQEMRKHRREMDKHMVNLRNLVLEDIGEKEGRLGQLTFEIRTAVVQLDDSNRQEATAILSECLSKLNGLSESIKRRAKK